MKSEDRLGKSAALGFWTAHTPAMDALYDWLETTKRGAAVESELPAGLLEVWESRSESIGLVIDAAEKDAKKLLTAVGQDFDAEFARGGSPFRAGFRSTRDPWVLRRIIEPRRGKLPKGPIYFTASIEEGVGEELFIYTNLWSKGGRVAGELFMRELREVDDGTIHSYEDWATGVGVLGRHRLAECMLVGEIDLDQLREVVRKDFAKQENSLLDGVLRSFRGL